MNTRPILAATSLAVTLALLHGPGCRAGAEEPPGEATPSAPDAVSAPPPDPTPPAPSITASAAALAMVDRVRETLGRPYRLGGRCRSAGDGIDCQGVLFYAAERVGECSWRSYSVNPTETVADRELGDPVPGLDPVASSDLALEQLLPGDVLFLVDEAENPAEPAIGTLAGTPVWVWHTGLYAGDGRWIVGDHYAGRSVETDLLDYLRDHAGAYQGVFVLRLTDPPRSARCRTGSSMPCSSP